MTFSALSSRLSGRLATMCRWRPSPPTRVRATSSQWGMPTLTLRGFGRCRRPSGPGCSRSGCRRVRLHRGKLQALPHAEDELERNQHHAAPQLRLVGDRRHPGLYALTTGRRLQLAVVRGRARLCRSATAMAAGRTLDVDRTPGAGCGPSLRTAHRPVAHRPA